MKLESIGADPELFVSSNGRVSSAIGKLGGSKDAPRMIDGYGIQEDNVLAEFSMPPVFILSHAYPAASFVRYVQKGIDTVKAELDKHNLVPTKHTSHSYSPRTLQKYGPSALEFGCDPDYSAYKACVNPAPDCTSTLRTAGGHVHVGYEEAEHSPEVDRMVVKAMDLFLGVPSVLIDPDNRRRELYGKAGAYRSKSYGIEYRTLSNFWIHEAELISWVYKQTTKAVKAAGTIHLILGRIGEAAIEDCINTGDKELARVIVDELNIEMPEIVHAQAA